MEGLIATLEEAGFTASLHATRPNISDVLVRGYPLPEETCREGAADIVLPVPSTFPSAAPYGFFAVTPITRRAGAWRNVSNAAPYPTWVFFSRKCEGWDPSRHDVLVFLGFINQWLTQ